MEKLTSLVNHFNELWPESEVAEWDRSGLMIGELTAEIQTVVLSVDVTMDVLEHAKQLGANLILSHHPMFLRGMHTLREDLAKGAEAGFAIKNQMAVFPPTPTLILFNTESRKPWQRLLVWVH